MTGNISFLYNHCKSGGILRAVRNRNFYLRVGEKFRRLSYESRTRRTERVMHYFHVAGAKAAKTAPESLCNRLFRAEHTRKRFRPFAVR